jgi:DNA-binding response OmpR family regulator
MKPKVLYVEDEPFLAQIVRDGMVASGFEVFHETDGMRAITLFRRVQPDICVLDIMLPMRDGFSLAQEIRQLNRQLPIIFLSAKTLTEDVIRGFKVGGNDYLKKPFSIEELIVRMESLLRRFQMPHSTPSVFQSPEPNFYEIGQLLFYPKRQVLQFKSQQTELSFKESELLKLLILHRDQILNRQTALRQIWGDDSIYNARSMDVFMTKLRKLLSLDPSVQILTIRGIGYKLVIE